MENFSKNWFKVASVIYFAVIASAFLFLMNKWTANQDIDVKIKKELHIANLIGQYNNDLNNCFEEVKTNRELTEEFCIISMNESELAKLIISWGYEDILSKAEKK